MYPTLAEVLALPVLKAAAPRVRAGSAGLDVPVRWVHVSEQANPAGTLTGGELVLSIGVALADPARDPAAYVDALRDAGAVGLVVELGQHVHHLPSGLVEAARRARFPLVELTRAVRFVEVTEVVHAQILNSQYARMRFTQQVHETFRTLTVAGGEVSRVLAAAAELTGLPVVLEDLGHRALSFAGQEATAALLKDWTARSMQVPVDAGRAPAGPEGWLTAPVGPGGQPWGRLVVPLRVTGEDAVDEVALVLEHAADALAIRRLLGEDPLVGLEVEAQSELLQDLLRSTTLDEPALRARARALGLPTGGVLSALVVGGRRAEGGEPELVDAAVTAARTARVPAIAGRLAPGRVAVVVWSRSGSGAAGALERVVELLPGDSVEVAGAAGPVPAFSGLPSAVAEAAFIVDVVTATGSGTAPRIRRASDLGVQGLLWQMRTDPRLLSYVDAELGVILRLDDRTRRQMLETLTSYLEAGGQMTAVASTMGLSRPAAYARLARLREVLGRDLEQPRTRLALHLALLALRQAGPQADGRAAAPTAGPAARG